MKASKLLRAHILRLAIITVLTASAPEVGRCDDLMDVLRAAIQNDPTLATADATRLVQSEEVPQARSLLLPQLSVGLNMSQIRSGSASTATDGGGNVIQTGNGRTRARALTAEITSPLINLSDIAALKAAREDRSAAEETYRAAIHDLYLRVATAYFTALVAEDTVDVYLSYEDAYRQEFEQTAARYKAGMTMESDMTQSQAYYQYIKSKRITAQLQLKDAQHAIEEITGKNPGVLRRLRDDVAIDKPTPSNVEAWIESARQLNPKILASGHTVDADEHDISSHRSERLPTLDATIDRYKSASWSDRLPGGAGYPPGTTQIGLALRIPLFTGGLTSSKIRQAISQRDADLGNLEKNRREATRDVQGAYNSVVDGVDQVRGAREAVEAAKKSLASMRAGYEAGTQNLTNVVVAIGILADIQTEYSADRHNLVLNQLLLKQAAGTIAVQDIEDVNRLLQ
jgi:outer membrane protein